MKDSEWKHVLPFFTQRVSQKCFLMTLEKAVKEILYDLEKNMNFSSLLFQMIMYTTSSAEFTGKLSQFLY